MCVVGSDLVQHWQCGELRTQPRECPGGNGHGRIRLPVSGLQDRDGDVGCFVQCIHIIHFKQLSYSVIHCVYIL